MEPQAYRPLLAPGPAMYVPGGISPINLPSPPAPMMMWLPRPAAYHPYHQLSAVQPMPHMPTWGHAGDVLSQTCLKQAAAKLRNPLRAGRVFPPGLPPPCPPPWQPPPSASHDCRAQPNLSPRPDAAATMSAAAGLAHAGRQAGKPIMESASVQPAKKPLSAAAPDFVWAADRNSTLSAAAAEFCPSKKPGSTGLNHAAPEFLPPCPGVTLAHELAGASGHSSSSLGSSLLPSALSIAAPEFVPATATSSDQGTEGLPPQPPHAAVRGIRLSSSAPEFRSMLARSACAEAAVVGMPGNGQRGSAHRSSMGPHERAAPYGLDEVGVHGAHASWEPTFSNLPGAEMECLQSGKLVPAH